MAKKMLVEKSKGKYLSKPIKILDVPRQLLPATSKVAWSILKILATRSSYPSEIASMLKMNEQNIYYHIRKLEKAGLIEVVGEEGKRGAVCKYYSVVAPAFGLEMESEPEEVKMEDDKSYGKLRDFFREFIKDGIFNGSIVVGSPLQHGPYLTSARDSHYAVHLGMFIGNFCTTENRFIVKLDTEVKAESAEKRNMILVGGPVTNIISNDINDRLNIKFRWKDAWKIYSGLSGKTYVDEDVCLIAKVRNPFDKSKTVILLAGLRFEGTKACVIAITQNFDKVLKDYSKEKDFYRLVKGLDRDGDGKVDYIQVLE